MLGLWSSLIEFDSIMQLSILRLAMVPVFLLFEDVAASLSVDALAGSLVFCSFRIHGLSEFVRGSSLFELRPRCWFGRRGYARPARWRAIAAVQSQTTVCLQTSSRDAAQAYRLGSVET